MPAPVWLSRFKGAHPARKNPKRVALPGRLLSRRSFGGEKAAVPDAWLLFQKGGEKPPFLFEIDLGAETLQKFKHHASSRLAFTRKGRYQAAFGAPAVLIAYLAISEGANQRAVTISGWTQGILRELRPEQVGHNL